MDIHFNSYKVRYQKMDQLLSPVIRSTEIRSVNIFINFDDIFHKLHRPQVNVEFQMSGEHSGKRVISNVLNVIAHYRQWAVRKGWQTRVIGFYTSAIHGGFKNKVFIPNYRKKFCDINHELNGEYYFINQGIRDAEKLFKVISQYIDKVYVIDSRFLEPSIIPAWFSESVFNPSWNIIISRDSYDMQYAYKDRWTMIYPKGDSTLVVDQSNLWNIIGEMEKIDNIPSDFDPRHYVLTMAITGDAFRNIPRIKRVGWKTVFKLLERVMPYSEDHSFIGIQRMLIDELISKNTTRESIENNINAIGIDGQVARIGEIDAVDLNMQVVDIPDYENLLELNNLYFSKYPINLPFLTEQRERKSTYQINPFQV